MKHFERIAAGSLLHIVNASMTAVGDVGSTTCQTNTHLDNTVRKEINVQSEHDAEREGSARNKLTCIVHNKREKKNHSLLNCACVHICVGSSGSSSREGVRRRVAKLPWFCAQELHSGKARN